IHAQSPPLLPGNTGQQVQSPPMTMETEAHDKLSWDDFQKVEMRVGTILSAEVFKGARSPAYKMVLDFGDLGTRKTSAQLTTLYQPENLVGRQVVAVINFPPKQIAT